MAAGDQERDEGKSRRVGFEQGREQVSFQMVHADDGKLQRKTQAGGDGCAY